MNHYVGKHTSQTGYIVSRGGSKGGGDRGRPRPPVKILPPPVAPPPGVNRITY